LTRIHRREVLASLRSLGQVFDIVMLLENLGQRAGPNGRATGQGTDIIGE